MNQIDLWKVFVEAQDLIVNALPPFYLAEGSVEPSNLADWKAAVDLLRYRTEANQTIRTVFEGLNPDLIDYELGIIQKPEVVPFRKKAFNNFQQNDVSSQLHLFPDPAVIFHVKAEYTENDIWARVLGAGDRNWPDRRSKVAFLTRSEILEISSGSYPIKLDAGIGAVFNSIHPSEQYILGTLETMKRHLADYRMTSLLKDEASAHIYNEWIAIEKLDAIIADTCMLCEHVLIAVRVKNNEYLYDHDLSSWRRSLGIYWFDEEYSDNVLCRLKRPTNGYFPVVIKPTIEREEFSSFIHELRRNFVRVFGEDDVKIQFRYEFRQDRDQWKARLAQEVTDARIILNPRATVASFDFRDDEELRRKWDLLSNIDILSWPYHIDDHYFKVRYKYLNPLDSFQENLKRQFPGLNIYYSLNKDKLTCAIHYKLGDVHTKILATEKLRGEVVPRFEKASYQIDVLEPADAYDYYPFDFKQSEIEEDLERMMLKLRRNTFGTKDGERMHILGEIEKVKFPEIHFNEWASSDETTRLSQVPLYGNFKGDQDRIKRLKETIEKIYSKSNKNCANPKIKAIIKDSSAAEGQDDVEGSLEYKALAEEVNSSLLGKRVNEKQLEAIIKSLLANDLFIIQGPPGTGKSTSISEIVWQHLKDTKNYRVLITSETNLAVDNALDKLRSPYHNLIKPLRFGSVDRLDKEGKRFSVETIERWLSGDQAGSGVGISDEDSATDQENIVQDWMHRVAGQSGHYCYDEKYSEELAEWKRILQEEVAVKKLFFEEYMSNVNVVGATCSTIGERSSTGNPTRFFSSYCGVFYPKKEPRKHSGIRFDLAIQDEASKASPPEMAIPMVYSKKNIIIGDHRQLPPMVDSNEFIDDITAAAYKSEDPHQINQSKKIVRVIKKHRNMFDESHFERLYMDINPSLKTSLDTQYRMHSSINDVIQQFYTRDNGLACGLDYAASNTSDLNNPESRYHGIDIPSFIAPEHHIVWVNTSTPELKEKTSRYNPGEVSAVDKVISLLSSNEQFRTFQSNWQQEEDAQIGIISFYGAQLKKLEQLRNKYPEVPMRISTVDRFQGMERNVIIVSTVRSDKLAAYEEQDAADYQPQPNLGFADSPNRLNVALSRAKRLLVIVGNVDHFISEHHGRKAEIYANVVALIKRPDNPHSLFIDAEDLHQL